MRVKIKMVINKKIINKLEQEAKKYFEGASGCHDWSHIERVNKIALAIGKKEGADLTILRVAALLHDIGRKEEMENHGLFCHAEKGGEMAREILKKYKIKDDLIDKIVHCIKTHRFRGGNIPESIEAKILFDADKLDSIGAVGVARTFLFSGNAGSNCLYTGNEKKLSKLNKDFSFTKEDSAILEYEVVLKKIKDKVLTRTGKKIATNRHNFMKKFFERFWEEVKGKR